ncbi:hypothetical protein ACFWP2_12020 [Kitasatospora sp. NPDC058444]|uniref:hypothetical protein n=1 Tax=Kitasatospora sp. NPDC058444 TaxID=3346504 RepID=UPI003659DFAB
MPSPATVPGAEVLRCTEAAVAAARAFLSEVDADPATAYDASYKAHALLGARAAETAEDGRDEVRSPGGIGAKLELCRAVPSRC